jgi:peptidyl-tRNA hydrolase
MLQSAHAAIEFQHEHPQISEEWNTQSKYLVFLSVENESQLNDYLLKAKNRNIKCSVFLEPDIGNQLTAIALEPGEESKRLTSNLPLALKNL